MIKFLWQGNSLDLFSHVRGEESLIILLLMTDYIYIVVKVQNIDVVSDFGPIEIGNVSDIGGNVCGNMVILQKFIKIVKKLRILL